MYRPLIESDLSPRRQPFLYLTAALVVGILADRELATSLWVILALLFTAAILAITFVWTRTAAGATLAILIAVTTIGSSLSLAERTRLVDTSLARLFEAGAITPNDPVELTGLLLATPEPAPESRYLEVGAESVRTKAGATAATGRVRLFVPSSDADDSKGELEQLQLANGSRVRILVRLERARTFSNPGSPDFNEFLERQGFELKGTVKSPLLIERIGDAPVHPLLATLDDLRTRTMERIDAVFKSPGSGTLKAMIVGNRHFLDAATIERLRESGTFHVLSISGMHVGIIAWVLMGGWLRRGRRAVVPALVCLTLLWVYAVMVGLAPPVTRATVMITVGLIGPLLFRRSASLNTVALAAFVMLALKPALVADPSFQLSFTAVAGIVALALPLTAKLRAIGEWQPTTQTPHPPVCSRVMRSFAESLFWNHRRFTEEMRHAPVRFRLEKTGVARVLGLIRLQGVARAVVVLLITSASIQLFTLPLMAAYFNRVTPIGVLLNIVAGLLTAVLMLGGLAAIGTSAASSWLAGQVVKVVEAARYLLVNGIEPFSSLPGATFRVAHYDGWGAMVYIVYFAPLLLVVFMIDRWRPVGEGRRDAETRGRGDAGTPASRANEPAIAESPRLRVAASSPTPRLGVSAPLAVAALLIAIIAVVRPISALPNGKLTVYFLDVGQGDSALIVFPRGTTMLVDGGGELRFGNRNATSAARVDDESNNTSEPPSPEEFSVGDAVVSRFLWSIGLTRVDYIVATHADADHVDGLSDVVRNFRVGEAVVGHVPASGSDLEFDAFAKAVSEHAIPLATIAAGDGFEIEGVQVEVLWPPGDSAPPVRSGNNDSVVLRLSYRSVSLLLTGDIEQLGEDAILQSGFELHADLLKVPHHGSRSSSSLAFIDAVDPRCALISVGERSRFGHPNNEVIDRYRARGIRLLQTGRDGMITFETDGGSVELNTYRKPGD
ncbi:MAG TPA: ComEC/Rec2 family competence protein [Blastocatellia bacterium]|nr:ComEC/Rec2 family competence protein [Blastocatellia bacterium]